MPVEVWAGDALVLECDTLHVPDTDQLVVVYSAAPDTPEAGALALLRVVGTQEIGEDRGASVAVRPPA